MDAAHELVRAVIALIAAASIFYLWDHQRIYDPDYYKFGAAFIVFIGVFGMLHLISKEG